MIDKTNLQLKVLDKTSSQTEGSKIKENSPIHLKLILTIKSAQ